MTPTRFDIYVREQGRWRLHESLPGNDKSAAISMAVGIDSSDVYGGVRAMAVVEYKDRPPLETLAWISPHLNKMASVQRQLQASAAIAEKVMNERRASHKEPAGNNPDEAVSGENNQHDSGTSPKKSAENSKLKYKSRARKDMELKAAGKVVGSGVIAIVVTAVLYLPIGAIVRALGSHITDSPEVLAGATLALIVLVFVVTSAILMTRVYREFRMLSEQMAEAPVPSSPRRAKSSREFRRKPLTPKKHDGVTLPHQDSDEDQIDAEDDDPDEADEVGSLPESTGTLTMGMRRAVLEFLANALFAIKDEVPRMNQHVAFGLNLFGAGAVEQYGAESGLSRLQAFVLVREAVEVLGNSPDRVDAFCRQYDAYKEHEQYRMMIDAGREVMSRHIKGDADPFNDFADTINDWTSNASARAQSQGVVCIMFTDLVGSTQMTHERGDYGAQEVVRTHNAIVRSALAAHHGREVKHTGDGIMASFTSVPNAVRSAINIRRELKRHNGVKDAIPVRVRIGLNAGEAVQEEDDFFGTTVQLAARVCDKADEGEIFVTDNVRELSKGRGIVAEAAGQFEMKGVPEPMTLFRIVS